MIIFFILGMASLTFSESKLYKNFKKHYEIPEEERELGIFLSFVKAKKDKVCPLIEVDYEAVEVAPDKPEVG